MHHGLFSTCSAALLVALVSTVSAEAQGRPAWVDPPAKADVKPEPKSEAKPVSPQAVQEAPQSSPAQAAKPETTTRAASVAERGAEAPRRARRGTRHAETRHSPRRLSQVPPNALPLTVSPGAPPPSMAMASEDRFPEWARKAQRLNEDYLDAISEPGDGMVAAAPRFYADHVRFHGRTLSLTAVMAEKRRFVRRWPDRRYVVQDGSPRTACSVNTSSCIVRSTFDFRAANPRNGARSQGVAELTLEISFAGSRPVIVSESSRVLRRFAPGTAECGPYRHGMVPEPQSEPMIATAPKTRATDTSRAADKTRATGKASKTNPSDEAEAPAICPLLGLPERAVRSLIDAEIRRQNAFPVARRTLQLLAEAVVEPTSAPPFYRIVNRSGTPRQGETGPLTLSELFAELRERHGALFVPVPPEPVADVPPEPTASDEIKAATSRFVETQSELARSVMARSVARGRSAAAAVSATLAGTLSNVRHSLADRPSDGQGAGPQPSLRERGMRIGASFGDRARETVAIARERLSGLAAKNGTTSPLATPGQGAQPARWPGLLARAGDRVRRLRRDDGTILTRPSVLAGAGLLGSLALILLLTQGGGEDRPASAPDAEGPRQETKAQDSPQPTQPPQTQQAQNQPSTMTNPRETVPPATPPGIPAEEPSPPSAEESRANPPQPSNAVTGKTEVIDTATLRVGGKLVRLFGVEWVRGGQPEELTRYLAGRPVTCQPVAGSAAYLCAVEGRDLSEVVLFNGGGRASSEATPDLVAAEDRARTERLGVWAR